jgi:outer membrane immunogenic protein
MNKAWLSSAAVVAFVTSSLAAFAADVPVNAPAIAPIALYNWTGCYIGGHIGSGDGGQIGCDYQFASGWVLGAEGRAAWTDLKKTKASAVTDLAAGVTLPSQLTLRNDFLASATVRLGYSFVDRWLPYVKGGAAWAHEKLDDAFINVQGTAVDPSTSLTRTGWTIGTGVERAFARNWSTTLEYDYYDFGGKGLRLTDPNAIVIVSNFKVTIHALTVGVNYRF